MLKKLNSLSILAILTALCAAIEVVLLHSVPRRSFTDDDAPRLLADVHLVREYFTARDETGEARKRKAWSRIRSLPSAARVR